MIDIKYKNMYDKFIEHYKNVHVNPWHEISEEELKKIYDRLVSSMNINDDYNFKYFMDYIIKRLSGKSDAHTQYDAMSLIPMNFRIFDNEILINYPSDLKNSKLISINGICIEKIIDELEQIITYGTLGKRRYELEKALFNKYMLFGIPTLRSTDELVFEIEQVDGTRITRKFYKNETYSEEELRGFRNYSYGNNATYKYIDNCLVYKHSSVQIRFKKDIESAIAKLRKEDLSTIDTIIIDIRGNTGGTASLNDIVTDFLKEHRDKKLICLTDYRVFSGGRYALRDLIKLGATTIGEEISTPTNCFGDSNWLNLDGYLFSSSGCYFHPFADWYPSSKEEYENEKTDELLKPHLFKPDIFIEEKKEDYMQGIDTILNYAIEYSQSDI